MDREEFEDIARKWNGDPWKIPVLIMRKGDYATFINFSEYGRAMELAAEGFTPSEIVEVPLH